ncbi:MAG: hypothetical protein K2N26_05250 [Oscillospiraceae bacterium]|nr:hypothetical protein [Oscillospiraceae bacterium]
MKNDPIAPAKAAKPLNGGSTAVIAAQRGAPFPPSFVPAARKPKSAAKNKAETGLKDLLAVISASADEDIFFSFNFICSHNPSNFMETIVT